MEHEFGTTEIPAEPQRVVSVGLTEHDMLLALGVVPVGVTEWYGEHPHAASPWDAQSLLIGRSVGRSAAAQALVDGVHARFAAAAADHPEFAEASVVFLQNAFYEGQAIAYQDGLSTAFLTDLGFSSPPSLDPFGGRELAGQAHIPLENLSVLNDGDVLLWATEAPEDRTALEAEPLYQALEPVQDGRLVFTDG